jgi:hypothetical protein
VHEGIEQRTHSMTLPFGIGTPTGFVIPMEVGRGEYLARMALAEAIAALIDEVVPVLDDVAVVVGLDEFDEQAAAAVASAMAATEILADRLMLRTMRFPPIGSGPPRPRMFQQCDGVTTAILYKSMMS